MKRNSKPEVWPQILDLRQASKLKVRRLVCPGYWVFVFFFALTAVADPNPATAPLVAPSLPSPSASILRVTGALALVIGIFLGGVWFFKNWQRVAVHRGRAPKLNILENRSLGGGHAIFVIGYEQQRFLISSSPGGVTFLSHLPAATEGDAGTASGAVSHPTFTQALAQVLKGK